MTDKKQPDAPAFCWETELAMTQQPVTLSVTEAREVSAEMQRMRAKSEARRIALLDEMQKAARLKADIDHKDKYAEQLGRELAAADAEARTMRAGYAAARLEIESLQARIKAMAEEHADELMVAHLDGRMRAAQPAGAQQPGDERAAFEQWSKVTNQGYDLARNVSGKLQTFESTETEHAWRGFFHGLRASHGQAQPAPQPSPASQGQAPAQAAPAAVAGPSEFPHEQMDAVALARYKVVPSHESMLHRHVVVAGDGSQQLYIGREVECENMARKFAGAFLDGAFAFHSMLAAAPTPPPQAAAPAQAIGPCVICGSDEPFTGTCGSGGDPRALCKQPAPTPQADSQPAPVREEEREAFKAAHRHLELDEVPDAWGRPMFKHSHVEASWLGWIASAARAKADSVLEDAARLDWLALAGPTSICVVIDREHDGEVEVSTDDVTGYGKTLREALDAARKQGANHD